ncbi:unannotated protein [freshwater metagenome]|uniref:Unannotated protein n=1 Tax=freshwater metagenome TaxID=449393 RepID=A0A6J6V7Y3_9ZZZZ
MLLNRAVGSNLLTNINWLDGCLEPQHLITLFSECETAQVREYGPHDLNPYRQTCSKAGGDHPAGQPEIIARRSRLNHLVPQSSQYPPR